MRGGLKSGVEQYDALKSHSHNLSFMPFEVKGVDYPNNGRGLGQYLLTILAKTYQIMVPIGRETG